MSAGILIELSPRARRYLDTLERRAAVPTAEVESIIREAGFPCFAPWLAFHDRYAGYVEQSTSDWSIWGLAHRDPYWWDANTVHIKSESNGLKWSIACADGHPSCNYRLDHAGVFVSGYSAESFGIHVERIALGWEFKQGGKFRSWTTAELRDTAFREVFEECIKPHLVPEASDRFSRCYRTDTYFVEQSSETGSLQRGFERTSSV